MLHNRIRNDGLIKSSVMSVTIIKHTEARKGEGNETTFYNGLFAILYDTVKGFGGSKGIANHPLRNALIRTVRRHLMSVSRVEFNVVRPLLYYFLIKLS